MKNLDPPRGTVSSLVVSLLLVIAALLVHTPAAALTYNYIGTPFTTAVGPPFPSDAYLADHITISFTYNGDLSAVLGTNLVGNANLTAFFMRCGALELTESGQLYVDQLVSGLPIKWRAWAENSSYADLLWEALSENKGYPMPYGMDQVELWGNLYGNALVRSNIPGAWSAVVPLPPSAVLLGSGLIPLAWARRKKRLGR